MAFLCLRSVGRLGFLRATSLQIARTALRYRCELNHRKEGGNGPGPEAVRSARGSVRGSLCAKYFAFSS
jgi:hypothetical protein